MITEVMTDNRETLRDDFGEYPDWIEIFNPGAEPVDMTGYGLTDDASNLSKWKFPSVRLAGRGYLVVFASGVDRADPEQPLHTNFRLGASGEYLALVEPDGKTVVQEFAPALPSQTPGVSYGLAYEEVKGGLVIARNAAGRFLVPKAAVDGGWTQPGFDDSQWPEQRMPAMYNRNRPGTPFDTITGEDVESLLYGENATALIRIRFTIADVVGLNDVQFSLHYDDGFVAYLNGTEVARDRAPDPLEWDSVAVLPRVRDLDPERVRIDLSDRIGLLRTGENVLAIHALNRSGFDVDFLMAPELIARQARVVPGAFRFFEVASPGFPNSGGAPGTSGDVKFSVAGGTFERPFALTLESVDPLPGTVIRYTVDGSTPGEQATLYAGPIPMNATRQVRARTFTPGLLSGVVRTETFLRLSSDVAGFTSDLPIIVIHTLGGGAISASAERAGVVTLHEPMRGRSSIASAPQLVTRASFRRRGSSTEGQPKANYAVEFWDEADQPLDLPLLGMPAESDWVFHAPYNFDPSLIHNPLAFEMSHRLGRYSPRYRFAEVFVNASTAGGSVASTHYVGVYNILEKIKRGPNRVDVDELRAGDLEKPEVTGGYMFKVDRVDPGDSGFSSGGRTLAYVDPKEEEMKSLERDPQEKYLAGFMNDFWRALSGANFTDPVRGYAPFIDRGSWVDHHIVDTLTFNVDALRLSSYLRKPRNGPLVYGPVWDYDRALGSTDGRDASPIVWGTGFFTDVWWTRLFRDPEFLQAWIDRWQETRRGSLSNRSLNGLIDRFAGIVEESAERDFAKWRQTKRGRTQAGEIDYLKNWLWARANFMDTNFLSAPQLSRASGYFGPGFQIEISGAGGGRFYYTVDGSDPRLAGGRLSPSAQAYQGPIVLQKDTVLRVRAYDPDYNPRRLSNGPQITVPWSGVVEGEFLATRPAMPGQIVVSELAYNPGPPTAVELAGVPGLNNDDFEFLELKNIAPHPIALSGLKLEGGIQFTFDPGGQLDPGGRVILVRNRAAFELRYGPVPAVVGVYSGGLGNGGELLRLLARDGSVLFEFSYSDTWYPMTDGLGYSLELADESRVPRRYGVRESWRPSPAMNGNPGTGGVNVPELSAVFVNEVRAFGDGPDAVELHNPGTAPIDIGGWYLTDEPEIPRKYRIAPGTTVPANGYLVLDEDDFNASGSGDLGFSFNRFGDQVMLYSANAEGVFGRFAHGFEFGPSSQGVSFGRYLAVDGGEFFVAQVSETLGAKNAGPVVGPIVIHEVMYHPPDEVVNGANWDNAEDEFVELWNVSNQGVPMHGSGDPSDVWTLRGGVSFDFPPGVSLAAGAFAVVVSFDPDVQGDQAAAFRTRQALPPEAVLFGPFKGKLGNGGDFLRLLKPGEADETTHPRLPVDVVSYTDGAPWPPAADGLGHSLQRVTPIGYGLDSSAWAASAPTAGRSNGVAALPSIVTQPTSLSVVEGGRAQFSVVARGEGPLVFQWRRDGRVVGAGPVLAIDKAGVGDAGRYEVIVVQQSGSVRSQAVVLDVQEGVRITEDPSDRNVPPGETVVFGVTVRASGRVNYQWSHEGIDLPGATGATLSLADVQIEDSGDYRVSVSDGRSIAVSAPARLNVLVPPQIIEPPRSQIALVGQTVLLSVEARGTLPMYYSWRGASRALQSGVDPVLKLENVQLDDSTSYVVTITNLASGSRGRVVVSATLVVLADFDRDGMADLWEIDHGLLTNRVGDAHLDPDGDGYDNLQEYLADTDPNDPASVLRFQSVETNPESAVLEFLARTNRLYSIQFSDSLGSWRTLTNINLSGENQVQRVVDPGAKRDSRFYRIVIPSNAEPPGEP